MKKTVLEFHSCYDELLSKLFLMTYEFLSTKNSSVDSKGGTTVGLVSKEPIVTERVLEHNSCYFLEHNFYEETTRIYNNAYDLTAQEMIIYSLLLSKCIEEKNEEQVISYEEIQYMRNKRVGKSKLLDDTTLRAYDKAFLGLCQKRIQYDLGDSREKYKITYRSSNHPLLIVYDVENSCNGNKTIKYSLGPFGKTLIESKRYSNLVPRKYFQLNFNETMTYQIALYVCKILFIERRKRKGTVTITLNSIMKNINKFMVTKKYDLVKCCIASNFTGPNTKRLWDRVISKVDELLETLKSELKIRDFKGTYDVIDNAPYLYDFQYKDVKWLIYFNK